MTTHTTNQQKNNAATTAVDKAADKAQEATDKAQEKVSEVTSVAKEQAKRAATQVTEQAKSTVGSRMNEAAHSIGSVADAVRQTSHEIGTENDVVGRYGEQLAGHLEGVSSYLNEKGVEDVLMDLQDFARRQPAVFLGGAFMLGMVVGRFIRSSGSRMMSDYSGGSYDNYERSSYQGSATRYSTGYGTGSGYQTGLDQESTTFQE